MDCRAFRQLHGDWVDDILDPAEQASLERHIFECAPCARFDTLARRALMVARNAPPIEVSADFSARLAARIAEERRLRIAEIKPSHAERPPMLGQGGMVWMRMAAGAALVVGSGMAFRAAVNSRSVAVAGSSLVYDSTMFLADEGPGPIPATALSSLTGGGGGRIVVLSPMQPVHGSLLPASDDPLLDGSDRAGLGDVSATTVAATAPLWPTAQMAAHAANRFAAMEFGDVTPVASVMQTVR